MMVLKKLLSMFLPIGLGMWWISASASSPAAADSANWMASISNGARLSDLSIPGTHDSTTFAYRGSFEETWVITQTLDFAAQLNAGIRYLDIRAKCSSVIGSAEHDGTNGRAIVIFHGDYYLNKNFYDVLRDVNQFLDLHPSESVLLRFKHEGTNEYCTSDLDLLDAFNQYMITPLPPNGQPDNARHVWTGSSKNPTLGQLRGKLVILNDLSDCTQNSVYSPMRYGCGQFVIQDEYADISLNAKWDAIAGMVDHIHEANTGPKFVNHLSASTFFNPPSSFSDYENPRMLDHLKSRPSWRQGVVPMDFPTGDLIDRIVANNDGYLSSDVFYSGPARGGRIQNAWKPEQFINTQVQLQDSTSSEVQSSVIGKSWKSARWNIRRDAGGWVRIENQRRPGHFLHIENGSVECGAIDLDWESARWNLVQVGTNQYRIQSRRKPDEFLHVENGILQSSPIDVGAVSSRWNLRLEP